MFPFQAAGVRALLTHNSRLLADEMGLGKTIQAITALRVLVRQGKVRCALIVVPAGLVRQWRDEFRRWAPKCEGGTRPRSCCGANVAVAGSRGCTRCKL